jgi:hypothetical protein
MLNELEAIKAILENLSTEQVQSLINELMVSSGKGSIAIKGDLKKAVTVSGDQNTINNNHFVINQSNYRQELHEILHPLLEKSLIPERQTSYTDDRQTGFAPEDEPLVILTIESSIVEMINSRLSSIEELQQSSQLSSHQKLHFNELKSKVRSLEQISQELKVIAASADKILKDAIEELTAKLRALDQAQESNLLEASLHFCLRQQIELLQQFQSDLLYGKFVAYWLKSQPLAQILGQTALEQYPEIKEVVSPQQLEAFYFSLEQFLERLGHCLIWGRINNLDKPVTPVVLDDNVYFAAFENLKTLIPSYLPDDGIDQLKEYIDYLIKKLPSYRHISIE